MPFQVTFEPLMSTPPGSVLNEMAKALEPPCALVPTKGSHGGCEPLNWMSPRVTNVYFFCIGLKSLGLWILDRLVLSLVMTHRPDEIVSVLFKLLSSVWHLTSPL